MESCAGSTYTGLENFLNRIRRYSIGYPTAYDFDYSAMAELFARYPLNNVGDPYVDGVGGNHTKWHEREVVEFLATLFRGPPGESWGYVTTGGSEGNLYSLYLARTLHPKAVVYHSDSAHYSVLKAVDVLAMESVRIRTDRLGEIDYDDLAQQAAVRRDRPVVVVANVGTTMTEAFDDVRRINEILDGLDVPDRFIHADAALSGVPLALLDPSERSGFDFADGADSITISGHKFLGSPIPCGVVIVKAAASALIARAVEYTGTPDMTIGGSRSGHAPLLLHHAISRHGLDGLRERARLAREMAEYCLSLLNEIGWEAFLHRNAFTVVLRTPPKSVLDKWVLASMDGWSHVITMPGMEMATIDAFVSDLRDWSVANTRRTAS